MIQVTSHVLFVITHGCLNFKCFLTKKKELQMFAHCVIVIHIYFMKFSFVVKKMIYILITKALIGLSFFYKQNII